MLGRIFLNSRKERLKDGKTEFFVGRRTYVLNKIKEAITERGHYPLKLKHC